MSTALQAVQPASLMARFADRFGVDAGKMASTLKATCFRVKDGPEVSNEQLMALLVVADQYKLNPFTKELYAFPDKGGIVPVVGVDGWSRIINEHSQFDGLEFVEPEAEGNAPPAWIECVIHRKDRAHPVRVREYLAECKRGTQPWSSHPRRMLRHKALIQAARLAFGFAGIYDQDEAERIVERDITPIPADTSSAVQKINAKVRQPAAVDVEVETPPAAPTFATIAEIINRADHADGIDTALSLIHPGLPEDQRAELAEMAKVRRGELA